jgi:hypothetical protein
MLVCHIMMQRYIAKLHQRKTALFQHVQNVLQAYFLHEVAYRLKSFGYSPKLSIDISNPVFPSILYFIVSIVHVYYILDGEM